MSERNILRSIVRVSEKAAIIARAVRHEELLLSLLVREKKDEEKNPRFLHDFKTLADVLVQQVVKHDLGAEFPELAGHIYGEESSEFTSLDGENIHLKVGCTEEDTSSLLLRILGDEKASSKLANLVHCTVDVPDVNLPTDLPKIPINGIGIWIDPIDSTAEYISGGKIQSDIPGVFVSGLPCVTVLIGAFLEHSGEPVLGVINQPFHLHNYDRWTGKIIWGLSFADRNLSSEPSLPEEMEKVIILSSSESKEVKSRLINGGYKIVEAAGAGYKLMCVALGLVSAYVLSKPSTFFWDTCGVQAVLVARGGNIIHYSDAMVGDVHPLSYHGGIGTKDCCNYGGFIAYNRKNVLEDIMRLLK